MRKKKASARVFLSLALVGSMIMNAFAVDTTTNPVEVETTGGNNEVVDVVITFEKVTENDDGSVTEEKAVEAEDYVTESGMIVDYEGSSDMTTDSNNLTTGKSESEYTVINSDATYGAEGGSETTIGKGGISDQDSIKVEISLTEGGKNTATGDAEPVVTGDPKDYPEDGEYDYTTTTVIDQASVTVTTDDVTVENIVKVEDGVNDSDLTHVVSDTSPSENNDLIKENASAAPEQYQPGYEAPGDGESVADEKNEKDSYGFEYVGTGNTSQLWPAVVFEQSVAGTTEAGSAEDIIEQFGTEAYVTYYTTSKYVTQFLDFLPPDIAAKDENGDFVKDEEGFVLNKEGKRIVKVEQTVEGPDGNTYYLHRVALIGSDHNVEGWYEEGVGWVSELNGGEKYGAVYATPQQFILVDKETGETVTTYCADITTHAYKGFGYNVENLEDATYYTEEQAAMIRSIATNGYWGTTGTETDEEGNTVPKAGSLEAMKEMLRASGQFTEEELASLTDGVALTATQMAIWSCSNNMEGTKFVNAHYTGGLGNTETNKSGLGALKNSDVPEEKEDETKLLFKVYEFLTSLEPTEIENPTTADTVINADNFLKDMAVTVIEKAEEHENNHDEDDTNDVYVTDLSFALVVTPDKDGDDLVVKVLDANGQPLASGRIAGSNKEGETYEILEPDANGNYTLSGITMVEGGTNFEITLEGIQNLEEGVYLYTSEIANTDTEDPDDDYASQTMVGIAKGKREVGVSMKLNFELSVDDEIVVTEHVWRDEWRDNDDDEEEEDEEEDEEKTPPPPSGGDKEIEEIPDPEIPLAAIEPPEEIFEELPEEEIPLADVPETGDGSALWMALSVLSGSGLLALSFPKKRKED